MFASGAEQFFRKLYLNFFEGYIPPQASILDIGCQYGRFSVPWVADGHMVVGTDLEKRYENFIRKRIANHGNFLFRHENIDTTLRQLQGAAFDFVLCNELIYLFPDPERLIQEMKGLLKPGGVLAVSHRTRGYYIDDLLRKKDFRGIQTLLSTGFAGKFKAETPDSLRKMYAEAGLEIRAMQGISLLGGMKKFDPRGMWVDPANLSSSQQTELLALETTSELQKAFIENARYILVLSTKTLESHAGKIQDINH